MKEIDKIKKQDLITLDELGLQSPDNLKRKDFMEIIEAVHDKRSTIIASQLPISSRHKVIS